MALPLEDPDVAAGATLFRKALSCGLALRLADAICPPVRTAIVSWTAIRVGVSDHTR